MKVQITSLLLFFCFAQINLSAQNADTLPINQDSVYKNPEIKAVHPKGEKYMRTFLEQNINPATPVYESAPEGTYAVQISLLIDTTGKFIAKPITSFGYGMENEVLRVIRKLPQFIPAKQNGIPVKSVLIVPMTFVIGKSR